MDFSPAANFVAAKLKQLLVLAENSVLNINFPPITPPNQYLGTKYTTLGKRIYRNVFEARKDLRGQTYFWLGGDLVEFQQPGNSDIKAIEEGYISITPLNPDITDYQYLKSNPPEITP